MTIQFDLKSDLQFYPKFKQSNWSENTFDAIHEKMKMKFKFPIKNLVK